MKSGSWWWWGWCWAATTWWRLSLILDSFLFLANVTLDFRRLDGLSSLLPFPIWTTNCWSKLLNLISSSRGVPTTKGNLWILDEFHRATPLLFERHGSHWRQGLSGTKAHSEIGVWKKSIITVLLLRCCCWCKFGKWCCCCGVDVGWKIYRSWKILFTDAFSIPSIIT